ncbi:hypothetical protein SAY86_019893 [Trapa natans]|uniref:GATA-type domain-containing protein n=1 Tax=Trapa natans TaxID=22666 RepID=A0AAN7LNW5_TRANT|nr:hypothetical protein SAY86_019893 [Trapa natans]
MGKQGPCRHCGVMSTPLWRNGPPEKPVLCNACGSRWRTKGTLLNYTPLHARAEPEEIEDKRIVRMESVSLNTNDKEVKPLKRKLETENVASGGTIPDYVQNFLKGGTGTVCKDASNRWGSGSAVSNSESCSQFGGPEGNDLTGPAQSVAWDTMTPQKRTCVSRPKQSPVEKLIQDLYTILQEQQSTCFSGTSEEDLLLESETPMVSVEIGHGSVLFRHPNETLKEEEHGSFLSRILKSVVREEESEASSLSVENKQCGKNDACSLIVQKNSKEGVFDVSLSGEQVEDCKTLRNLVLLSPVKSKWMEHHYGIMKCDKSYGGCQVVGPPGSFASNLDASDLKVTMKKSKREVMRGSLESKKATHERDNTCFSPKSLFAVPSDGNSLALDSSHFTDESCERDLLLDVPFNSSFPQAELLHPLPSVRY